MSRARVGYGVGLLLLSLLAACAHADLDAASRCSLTYVSESSSASTAEGKCHAFFRLVNCNADAAKTASAEDTALIQQTQDQVAANLGVDCTPYQDTAAPNEPQVYSANGSLYFEVDESKSITFVRTRRDVVTAWSLVQDIDDTNTRVDDLASEVSAISSVQSAERSSFVDLVGTIVTQGILSSQSVLEEAAIDTEIDAAVSTEKARAMSSEEGLQSEIGELSTHIETTATTLQGNIDNVADAQVNSVVSLASAISSMESAADEEADEVLTHVAGLETRMSIAEATVSAVTACGSDGHVFTGSACAETQGSGGSLECTSETVGALRVHNGALQLCGSVDGSYEFVAFSFNQGQPLGSYHNPAVSAVAILQANENAESGLYWIQPEHELGPALTFCDMEFEGGGFMLAAYGHVHSSSSHDRNRAIPPMNHPNGYNWAPGARSRSNGVIALPSGAVHLARQSTVMVMAAGNVPDSGGLEQYTHVYNIDISHVRSFVTFENHNRDNGAVGVTGLARMTPAAFAVQAVRGDSGTATRYALRESLGVTWADTYPSGYGFNGCGLVQYCRWGDGPFFPSVHSGDQRCSGSTHNFQGADVACGRTRYVHRGWYGLSNGHYNRVGQTSIWFK